MYRIVIALTFACAMVVGVIGSPTRSLALQESATPEPAVPTEVCVVAERDNWENEIKVKPYSGPEADVLPLDSPEQHLYLVVWTIDAGTCIPYEAPGNRKDGAIVLIVQQGVVEFTAEPYFEGSVAEVHWGRPEGGSAILEFGETQRLEPGDWVTQNDQVWFTIRSIGDEPAVILKAVWARPGPMEPCSGGCK